jgi:hypothetical protein
MCSVVKAEIAKDEQHHHDDANEVKDTIHKDFLSKARRTRSRGDYLLDEHGSEGDQAWQFAPLVMLDEFAEGIRVDLFECLAHSETAAHFRGEFVSAYSPQRRNDRLSMAALEIVALIVLYHRNRSRRSGVHQLTPGSRRRCADLHGLFGQPVDAGFCHRPGHKGLGSRFGAPNCFFRKSDEPYFVEGRTCLIEHFISTEHHQPE